jgi:hypothetical protein
MPKESTPVSSSTSDSVTIPLEEAIHNNSADVLNGAVTDPSLTLDLALALMKRRDLPAEAVEQLGKNSTLMKSRKLKLAMVEHPRTPRHLSLPMVRHLFTFDLMKVALTPYAPADIRIAADEALANRLEKISMGERLSLAHRASERIARALLLDSETRIVRAALENSRLTEASIIKALMRRNSSAALVEAVCRDSKWSPRREIRMVLLRNEKTPLARALEFARSLPGTLVQEILQGSRLPTNIKSCVLKDLAQRSGSKGSS